jgi:pimeloyl-ACP methyl ester carboxylesterase
MSVSIVVEAVDPARFTVTVSPLAELAASLHVLTEHTHHPAYAEWAADVTRNAPPAFRAGLRRLAPLWTPLRWRAFYPMAAAIDLHAVQAPTMLWYGDADEICSVAHGHWYAERIVSAELVVYPDEDHLAMSDAHRPEILRPCSRHGNSCSSALELAAAKLPTVRHPANAG